jgi:hypothetical protein
MIREWKKKKTYIHITFHTYYKNTIWSFFSLCINEDFLRRCKKLFLKIQVVLVLKKFIKIKNTNNNRWQRCKHLRIFEGANSTRRSTTLVRDLSYTITIKYVSNKYRGFITLYNVLKPFLSQSHSRANKSDTNDNWHHANII